MNNTLPGVAGAAATIQSTVSHDHDILESASRALHSVLLAQADQLPQLYGNPGEILALLCRIEASVVQHAFACRMALLYQRPDA